jgi:hypothetical protein
LERISFWRVVILNMIAKDVKKGIPTRPDAFLEARNRRRWSITRAPSATAKSAAARAVREFVQHFVAQVSDFLSGFDFEDRRAGGHGRNSERAPG